MAVVTATKTGNWSDTTVWDTGALPQPGDTVRPASFIVTINQDVNLSSGILESISTGHFAISVTPRAIVAAEIRSSTGHSGGGVVRCSHASGTVTVTANVFAGLQRGIDLTGAGTLIINGDTIGGSAANAHGAYNNSAAGTLIINGNVTGGNVATAGGVQNQLTGTTIVDGNATGGAGGAPGANNLAGGTLRVDTAVGNDYGVGGTHLAAGVGLDGTNTAGAITTYKNLRFGAKGQSPVGKAALCEYGPPNVVSVYRESGALLGFSDPATFADLPAESDVRNGIDYGNGSYTGTCAVPAANQVTVGAPVDNTAGTAVLTAGAVSAAIAAANLASQESVDALPTASEIDTHLSGTHGVGSWPTATGFATSSNVTGAQLAIQSDIAAIKVKTDALPASPAATGDIPGTGAIASAIFAVAVETGHDLTTVLRAIYAAVRGRSVADDADDPATITYYAPDNTTARVTHTLTDTERTVA